jgi:radical SAM protein
MISQLVHPIHAGHRAMRDYAQTPLNIYWEMTQACALACRHCRASAMPNAHPNQLTFEESLAFLRHIPQFGHPMPQLILTGGDPLERPDLFLLIEEARRLGIGVSITPAATSALTREVLARLKAHEVEGLGLSLDGATAKTHDSLRGVPGTFARTIQAMHWAQDLGLPLQVNTLIAEETVDDIPQIYELLKPLGAARWSLFFLISVGRGAMLHSMSIEDSKPLLRWIYEISKTAPFVVATTEAPSYRRFAIQKMREEGFTGEEIKHSRAYRSFGIRDGHGIMFVSNTGEISPAGFLPLVAGNVRTDSVVDIYRNAPLFRALHDPATFEGKCGICEFHAICGGSRARAYATSGNPLAEDPFCNYEPRPGAR